MIGALRFPAYGITQKLAELRHLTRCRSSAEPHAVIDFDQINAPRRGGLELRCRGLSDSAPMRASLFGYFFGMITVLTAVVLSGLSNISTFGNGRHYQRPPVIGRTIMVETQRHSPPAAKESSPAKPMAKEASLAKEVSSVVVIEKTDTKKANFTSPKFSPVSATTTDMGTLWVMLKNIDMVQAVSFFR
jgi:hypothetical protein